jgi:predicted ester cyclase
MGNVQDENKQLIQRWVDEFVNARALDRIGEFMAEDCYDNSALPWVDPHGVAGPRELFNAMFTAFPNIHVTIEEQVAEGDKVMTRARFVGRHDGYFFAIPPTGREFDIGGIEILRVEDGKVKERWGGINEMALMGQLGLFGGP